MYELLLLLMQCLVGRCYQIILCDHGTQGQVVTLRHSPGGAGVVGRAARPGRHRRPRPRPTRVRPKCKVRSHFRAGGEGRQAVVSVGQVPGGRARGRAHRCRKRGGRPGERGSGEAGKGVDSWGDRPACPARFPVALAGQNGGRERGLGEHRVH